MGAVSRLAHVPLVWCVWPERGTRVADGVFRLPSPPQGIREPATEAEVRSLPCWNGRASWEAHLQWEAVLGRAAGGKGSSSQAWRDGQWCPGTCRTQGGGGLLTALQLGPGVTGVPRWICGHWTMWIEVPVALLVSPPFRHTDG